MAYRWLFLTAEQGVPDAQKAVYGSYANGFGAEQDFIKVYMWGSITIQSRLDDAKERFVYFINYMSPEQVDVAKILARDWMAQNSLRNYGNKKTRDG